ncbi:hypothetical protein M0805_004844 [Coniferiporia weirii]|nr:hypothetical protein M0805_004844 [Coniferiporia weirii]
MSKRVRRPCVESFLDLQAEISRDEEEEEEEEEEVNVFLNDADEFLETSTEIPASRLVEPQASVQFDTEAMAARFRERSRREQEAESHVDSQPRLWMIRCQPGREHLDAGRLECQLAEPSMAFGVSVLSGRFYVQAQSAREVNNARQNLSGIERAFMLSVPADEHYKVLRLRNSDEPALKTYEDFSIGDWVTVMRGTYRGDLGRVRAVTEDQDEIIVALVPRIFPKNAQKCPRPDPILFFPEKIKELCSGEGMKKLSENAYEFRRKVYRDGLCELKMPSLHFVRKAKPSLEDIGFFALTEKEFGGLDQGEPFLRCSDRVRITAGPQVSLIGVVGAITQDFVEVWDLIDVKGNLRLDSVRVCIDQVRRILWPGDHVRTRVGPGPSVEGMVITADDVSVCMRPVGMDTETLVRSKWVETYDPDFKMEPEHRHASPRAVYPHFRDPYRGTHPINKIAQITRDGSNSKDIYTVELKDLIAV